MGDDTKNEQFPFINDPHAPEFFVTGIAGAQFDGPNVRLTFTSMRSSHDPQNTVTNHVVNLRVVMSTSSAVYLAEFVQKFAGSSQLNATDKPPDQPLQ